MISAKHKHWLYGGLIILGGIVVIIWMRNFLVSKGVIAASPNPSTDPLGVGTLQLQSWFTTTIGAQPGTTAFPSQLQ
jgi:hypothetical protein